SAEPTAGSARPDLPAAGPELEVTATATAGTDAGQPQTAGTERIADLAAPHAARHRSRIVGASDDTLVDVATAGFGLLLAGPVGPLSGGVERADHPELLRLA